MDNSIKTIIILIFIIIVFGLLYILESILLPLILAFFAAALFQPLVAFLQKLKVPKIIIFPVILIISLAFLFGIFLIIQNTLVDIIADSDYLSTKITSRINEIFSWTNSVFGSRLSFNRIYKTLMKQMDTLWISQRATELLGTLSSFTTSLIMFILYYVVMLTGMANSKQFLLYVENFSPDSKISKSYERIQKAINSYLIIKTLLCLLMAAITYLVCLAFGVKFALFWAFITFIASYIPNIGSTISVIFPTLMAIITIDSIQTIFLFSGLLTFIHFLTGYVVEPLIMGSNMSINTITVIFGLVFWGFIWGIPGMMLSVPLLVTLKLVFEQFPSLEIFARIMGVPEKIKN